MSPGSPGQRWALGLTYIVTVAAIWIASSFVVQSVVDAGVSPFLVTYLCNSLFVIYIPFSEIGRRLRGSLGAGNKAGSAVGPTDEVVLLDDPDELEVSPGKRPQSAASGSPGMDAEGMWTRLRVAKASLLVCPFWFLAQLTFNLSLKYTTVTSNTILSSSSSLFTYLVSVVFLGEVFRWVKLVSVLLCMVGTVVVSLGDSGSRLGSAPRSPALGDGLAVASAALYAAYVTLIRRTLPSDRDGGPRASTALFLGFVGLFNFVIFLPAAFLLYFSEVEPVYSLSPKQLCLVLGKGLLDNVLSDYLWAEAVLLTSTTVATAGLTIQVPLAALLDSLTGNSPRPTDYVGAAAVMLGFTGINFPADGLVGSVEPGMKEARVGDGTETVDSK